uniref:RagB/SusD family nutrient uptake outer membrane protein n=1 Tax=uncultured Draconibacterium sp. TaxID=1573823 RepID=UPI003216BF97
MKLNKHKILILGIIGLLTFSCKNLDIEPVNLVTDETVFSSSNGIEAYMAEMYFKLPIEDFRYSTRGWNMARVVRAVSGVTGEAVGRDTPMNPALAWFQDGYKLIRDANVFIETLQNDYAGFHDDADVKHWLGEAHMIRAFAYTAMVKRYGGIPIVTSVIDDPELALIPRNSEEEVWDQIASDFQYAIDNMQGTSAEGRFNRYSAAAYKAQAMLHAASIANFSDIELVDELNGGALVCGIPSSRAVDYYTKAYEAAKLVDEGGYTLYMDDWKKDNNEAQYNNFRNIHNKVPNSESIFVKYFRYPERTHSWDFIYGPLQLTNGGLSGGIAPSWDFVSMFDRIGNFVDENNKYILYDNTLGPFVNAEPRLRATVLLPGDEFRGEVIEVYRGIYTGVYPPDGLSKLYDPNDNNSQYEKNTKLLVSVNDMNQRYYDLGNGEKMRAAGLSGTYNGQNRGTRTGFLLRKLLDESIPTVEVANDRSESDWVDMRYAEVLLIRAEAAYELSMLGQSGGNYIVEAFDIIQQIRRRAGADLMISQSELNREVIRKERKKEMAFEHEPYWDLIRWRTYHVDFPDNPKRKLKGALAFYVPSENKWFFDVKGTQLGRAFISFTKQWYYLRIPTDQISKNPKLIQNTGY